MNASIINLWNEDKQIYEPIYAIKGDTGPRGVKGDAGPQGADGYTPKKGIDYWTEVDKQEIIAAVKNSYQIEEWVFTLEDGSTITKTVVVR